ncbi:alcohol dehydrogenase [Karstenula rhodostoma CBS 690.94]|uniref:Alcohol dehydrogenase n=1 Tax=Karstenula rhodostoma CBS 690.94 TaxID=1392251 RepID=A0A9P4U9Z5_9PLEO|nr:alcohol dehydrogenase [Karstenula rhodostoma CBS 690.94]
MRALIRTGDKSPQTLRLDPNYPEPTPTDHPGSYIIRTKACALTRQELTWPEPKTPDTSVPGLDFAGEIISAPKSQGEHKFKPGEHVYALTTFTWEGNARDITAAHENELALKPKGLSWEETASIPLSALSAYQGLFVHGALKPPKEGNNLGKRVLVTAAFGGVGLWGVQLAHQADAEVVGTCGTSNVEFVKSLGVDTVLDYRKVDLLEWCARERGKVVSVAEPPDPKKPEDGVADGVQGVWFIVEPNGAQLAEVTNLLEQNKCQAIVNSVYELEQFEEAFKKLEAGHAKGKIILRVGV